MKTLMQTLPIGTDMEILYRESQGEKRDAEIFRRYEIIIDYFAENPDRAATETNSEILTSLYFNDEVLVRFEPLRKKLLEKILNSPEARILRDYRKVGGKK
jgi:hypothetical protein